MSLRDKVDDEDLEDLRFAVVMNGGVSLAVWIGGVAMELDRLAQVRERAARDGSGIDETDPYWQLLDLTKSTARIDVIAGTSAGGLNGAFLALATVYQKPLTPLGALWAETGAFAALLRSPLEGDPPSLLKGDGYFLPELRRAFETLSAEPGGTFQRPAVAPMTLHITTTLLDGEPRTLIDDFGTRITEIDHLGSFRFERGLRPGADAFADTHALLARLALASRSTASFPVAFEASYIPVAEPGPDRLHPDMAGAANFSSSRFVVDGGVLLNKPVRPALEAVLALPASRQVRRALVYVNPHPKVPAPPEPARQDTPPTMSAILLDALVQLPRAQSIHAELAELAEHNRRVRAQRVARAEVATSLMAMPEDAADQLYDSYRRARISRAISHIAALVVEYAPAQSPAEVPAWSFEEIAAAFSRGPDFPFIPPAGALSVALEQTGSTWEWGVAPLERVAAMATDVLKRALWLAPLDQVELRANLRGHRAALARWRATTQTYRKEDTRFWTEEVATTLPEPPAQPADRPAVLSAWVAEALSRWPVPAKRAAVEVKRVLGAAQADALPDGFGLDDLRRLQVEGMGWVVHGIAAVLDEAAADLHAAADRAAESGVPEVEAESSRYQQLLAGLVPPPQPGQGPRTAGFLTRLLRLEVMSLMLATELSDVEQEVGLLQISGDTPCSFGPTPDITQKLAGVKLGHFGAFYKKSWRVSDWIWGRLDGATRATQAVLSPARLRQLQCSTDEALALVQAVAVGPPGPDAEALTGRFPTKDCRRELEFLDEQTWPVPPSLPVCALAIARRLHLGILREELPGLARSVRDDRRAGSATDTRAEVYLAAYDQAVAASPEGLDADTVFALFRDARIGEETFEGELGSDLLASTISTTAAVGVATADSRQAGLGPLKAITRPLRGFVLTLYALVYGATRATAFGRAAVTAALATGGALLALTLLTEDTPRLLSGLGAVLVLGGVGLAALRSRMWQFALLLALPLAVLVLVGLSGRAGIMQVLAERAATVLVIVGLVLAAMLLGTIQRSPGLPWLLATATRQRIALVAALGAGTAVWVVRDVSAGELGRAAWLALLYRPDDVVAHVGAWAEDGVADALLAHVRWAGWLLPLAVAVVLAVLVLWMGQASQRARRRPPGAATGTLVWSVLIGGLLLAAADGVTATVLRAAIAERGLSAALTATDTVLTASGWLLLAVPLLFALGGGAKAAMDG